MGKPLSLFAFSFIFFSSAVFGQKLNPKEILDFSLGHNVIAPNTQKVAHHEDLPLQGIHFEWNIATWDTLSFSTYTYTANGDLVDYQLDAYNNGAPHPINKTHNSYDSNGNIIETIEQLWTGFNWENDSRDIWTYDAQGNQLIHRKEAWVSGAWVTSYAFRFTYQYNASNQITEIIYESLNTGTGVFEFSNKTVYEYAQGEWSKVTLFRWNVSNWDTTGRRIDFVWHDFSKRLFAYEKRQTYANGLWEDAGRATVTFSQFDSRESIEEEFNGTWGNTHRQILNFDAQGHNVFREIFVWNNAWELIYNDRNNYVYDGQGRTLEVVLQNLDSNMVMQNLYKSTFPNFFVGIETEEGIGVQVAAFPNPVTHNLNFDLPQVNDGPISIALFDVQGRKRLETLSNYSGKTVSIPISSSLENGIYFYQVKMNDAFVKGRVIIQH